MTRLLLIVADAVRMLFGVATPAERREVKPLPLSQQQIRKLKRGRRNRYRR